VIDGKFALDATIRHERMADDMNTICARLGIAWEPERMPTFKAGIRPKDATVAQLFTPKSRAIVERACARELALFGYAFPG
jgi:hypothetical protein